LANKTEKEHSYYYLSLTPRVSLPPPLQSAVQFCISMIGTVVKRDTPLYVSLRGFWNEYRTMMGKRPQLNGTKNVDNTDTFLILFSTLVENSSVYKHRNMSRCPRTYVCSASLER